MDFMGTEITPLKFVFHVLGAVVGWSIAFWLRASYLRWKSYGCRAGHQKKYVALTEWANVDCKKHGRHTSAKGEWWSTWGKWACDRGGCNAVGEDCFGTLVDWRIEHGMVVVDEKKTASRSERKAPHESIKSRLADEQGVVEPIYVPEALKILTELAVQVKKGRVGELTPPSAPAKGAVEEQPKS